MPALRELKKSPHARMRSGAGQAGAFRGRHTTRRLWYNDLTRPYCQLHATRDGSRTSQHEGQPKVALSLAGPSCPERKTPRRREFRRRVVVNALAGGQAFRTTTLRLLWERRQLTQRLMRRTGRRHLEFRLSITFARFKYSRRFFSSATTVSMVTPGTPFSKSFRLHALPSRRHRSLANFCRISSDIGLAHLVVQRVRHTIYSIKSP